MLTHADIWQTLDRLALSLSTSPSGLARQAGLDPTTFNKSKRTSPSGKERWPSTESLSKVLAVIGWSFEEFARFSDGDPARGPTLPLIGHAQAGDSGYFDDSGFPVGSGWDEVNVPGRGDRNAYCLQIAGDSMAPVMRAGDRVVVSPNETVRRGDRVLGKTLEGEFMAKELHRISETQVELISVNPDYDDRILPKTQIAWIARIVWIGQ